MMKLRSPELGLDDRHVRSAAVIVLRVCRLARVYHIREFALFWRKIMM